MTKSKTLIVSFLGCIAIMGSFARGLASTDKPNEGEPAALIRETPRLAKPISTPLAGKKLLIDPGHGGTDPGAMRAGVEEKNITLAVALALQTKLTALGATVDMTRTMDTPVPLPVRLADSNQRCPDLFLSIHVNAVSRSNITGIETYYYGNRSAPLAQLVLDKLSADLRETAKWSHDRSLFVLNGNRVPATLAEIGYLTNPQTRSKLNTPAYQDKVASALADSVLAYFSKPQSERGCLN